MTLYSCLWHSAINVLLITIEPDLVVKLLENRAKPLDPLGTNAGAELVEVAEAERETRRRMIMAGSQILTSSFMASLEEAEAAGVGDIFPESVLDQAIERLNEEWGPFHLRDALWDQAEALASGDGVIVDVREPVQSASRPSAPAAFARGFRSRAVVLRIDVEVSSGKPRWAYAMHASAADGSGFTETREACCPAPGANSLRAFLAGAAEALEAVRAGRRGRPCDGGGGKSAPAGRDRIDVVQGRFGCGRLEAARRPLCGAGNRVAPASGGIRTRGRIGPALRQAARSRDGAGPSDAAP